MRTSDREDHLLPPPAGAGGAGPGWQQGGFGDLRVVEDHPAGLGLWGWQKAGGVGGGGARWHWGGGTAEAWALETP